MKKLTTAITGLAMALGLAGCTSVPTQASPSSTPTVSAVAGPCQEFEGLTDDLATLVVAMWTHNDSAGDADRLVALPDDFDVLALKTDGAVSARMATVADMLQATSPIVMSTSPDQYFDAIRAVQRACQAEGVTIGVKTWTSGG